MSVTVPSLKMPPPPPPALLLEKVLFWTVSVPPLKMPPPTSLALLLEKVLFWMVSVRLKSLKMPPPPPTWKAFLNNHVKDLVALDFFVVPTITYKVLFVLVILAHARRRMVHYNVTEHPTAAWTAQQVVNAFPWDEAPQYPLRDRDRIYGDAFRQRVRNMGIEDVRITPRSPRQNPYVERLIGSIRRECLEH